ncbi:probable cytochrome P450 6a13 [Periplaneta americana]|uniref:probable cytochrome P450 6a13 n=1 Tax=Periplaneta americana TaxID=6978 RepID=UPI0037E916D6
MGFSLQELLLYVCLAITIVFAAVYVYFKWSYTYWKKRNVPCLEPSFPFGHFFDTILLRRTLGEILREHYRKLQGHRFAGTYFLTKPSFCFMDPDLIKKVLVKDFSHFHDRGFYLNEEQEPLTGHLFLLTGIKWRNLRIKLTPTFTSGKMKMMFQTVAECGSELQQSLKKMANKEEGVDIKEIIARFSTDVISSCAFGIQCNCLKNPNAEFREWGKKIATPTYIASLNLVISTLYPSLISNLRMRTFDPIISNYFNKMVEETVSYREKNNVHRNDFMQLLIQIKNKGSIEEDMEIADKEMKPGEIGLSMDCLAAQAFVFFLAGFETSSTTMSFCLYELSVNQDIQERVREEIDALLRENGGNITYEAIQHMEYLDKVVAETLRKYPPFTYLSRVCTKSYQVPESDVVVEEGTQITIPVLALHHDPKYYPDPERFDPERFNEEEKANRHQYVYLPFGEGPRICIGTRFGLMQTKVGLISLLSKYEFTLSEKTPVPLVVDPKSSFIMAAQGGIWLKIRTRVT